MSIGYFEGQNIYTRAFMPDDAVTNLKAQTFVSLNASKRIANTAAGAVALGVALEDYSKDGGQFPNQVWPNRKGVAVRIRGTAFVEAGAAVSAGQDLEVGANGTAVPLTTGKKVGVALTGAAAAGDMIEVLL